MPGRNKDLIDKWRSETGLEEIRELEAEFERPDPDDPSDWLGKLVKGLKEHGVPELIKGAVKISILLLVAALIYFFPALREIANALGIF